MRTSLWRRLGAVLGTAALAGWLLAMAGPGVALAVDDCGALGGSIVSGECQIPAGLHIATGTFSLDETLHFLAGAHVDATGGGITLNINGAAGLNLTMDSTSVLEADDDNGLDSGASASPITINVTGNMVMKANSLIDADNNNDGGSGGTITIDVDGNMTMCAAAGAQAGCGGASGGPGAIIRAIKTSGAGDTGDGGNITITVGDLTTATGTFYMEGGATGYMTETGAKVLTTGPGEAGDISITAGRTYFAEPGSVVEAGDGRGSTIQQGGKIFLVSGCGLTTEGRVTSKGEDPGADLVHLESCDVFVYGLVESTGKAHETGRANSCDNVNDGLAGEVLRPGKPAEATACIEVWAKNITIDSSNGRAGELNADIGDGGVGGRSWIDLFAFSKITVIDGSGNNRNTDNVGDCSTADYCYFTTYAVHANSMGGSDDTPNTVTALAKTGTLTGDGPEGHTFQAASTHNGSDGGTIDLESRGTTTLDGAFVDASGEQVGTVGSGGHIIVKAWGAGSDISWQTGSGDVRPPTGDIKLTACDTIDIIPTPDFHGETPVQTTGVCSATEPTLPSYVTTAFTADALIWAICAQSTVSGTKFNDLDADGVWDQGEPGLDGWVIHLFGTDSNSNPVHRTQTTANGGTYLFTAVPPGTYTICEQLPAVTPPWLQTFPTTTTPGNTDCVTPGDPTPDNPNPGPLGYAIDLTGGTCCAGQQITKQDFGNTRLASKSGIKWEDKNGNGTKDSGDDPLGGWDIHLFGTAGNGSAVHLKTTTAAVTGAYSFPSVLPGSYTVCEALKTGWKQTFPVAATPGSIACTAAGDPASDNPNPGPYGYAITLDPGEAETGNDFGNTQLGSKSGTKYLDSIPDGAFPFQGTLDGWKIDLFGTDGLGTVVTLQATTGPNGTYSFPNLYPGTYTVCEELLDATWTQTYPTGTSTDGTACDTGGYAAGGYTFTITSGKNETGNDFANHQTPVFSPPECKEDPNRTFLQTRTVNLNLPLGGSPANYHSIQLAYNDAANNAGEVIGLYSNTNENLTLGGYKTLTITQCTLARVTGAAGSPVWNITSTGKLTIIGPDAVGGTIGWRVAGNGGHTLKSIRANGASQYGVLVVSNSNSVSWNDVSGNGTAITDAGIRVEGGSNTLKGGTVATNKGDGVQLIGSSNTLSGSTITGNTGNGVLVAGSTNTVTSNSRINLNKLNGIYVTGSSNTLSSNASEAGKGNLQNGIKVTGNTNQLTDNKMNSNGLVGFKLGGTGNKLKSNNTSNNTGNEYEIAASNVDQGSNKKNGSSFTFTNVGGNFN